MRHDFYQEQSEMSTAQSTQSTQSMTAERSFDAARSETSISSVISSVSASSASAARTSAVDAAGNDGGRCHNFPRQAATFFDRDVERPAIIQRILDPRCQFLTLVGPGGIGKTRLAMETAGASAHAFRDGLYFVNVQPVRSCGALVSAIGDPMGILSSNQSTPRDALLHYLRDKEMLILLDNFEHLAHCATDLLADIVEEAPGVKLLVTSRIVLNLREEWLFPVHGLPYPHRSEDAAELSDDDLLKTYGAVQLFAERAGRVRRGFSVENERAGILRICQLTEGMPLALELAAAWAKSLSCEAIADEISRNIGFLTTQLRNTPAPHRSVRAVYEQTWSLLPPEEQAIFARLSVFHGGFQREAAEAVAGATLPTLSSLLDQSLLRRESGGRYHIHEMLRQYAEEQFNKDGAEVAETRNRHSTYYADLLDELAPHSTAANQRAVIQQIALELDNIRTAWDHAVENAHVETIHKAATSYYMYCDFRGRYHEGADACRSALTMLAQQQPAPYVVQTQALLQAFLGWHCIRLGQLEEARTAFATSQERYELLEMVPPAGFGTHPALGLALMHLVRGDYAEAIDRAGSANLRSGDKLNEQIGHYIMTNAEFAQGHFQQAAAHAQKAYVLTQETGNRWMMAYILADLGDIARMLEDYDQARRHYSASYDIKQELDDPEGCAVTLMRLAGVYYLQKSYHDAGQLYQESLHIYEKINDRGGLVHAQYGLGIVAVAQRAYEKGRTYLQGALNSAADMRIVPLTLTVLTGAADLFLHTDRRELGIDLLDAVLDNPAATHTTRQRVYQFQEAHNLPAAGEVTGHENFNTAIAAAQTELAAPCAAPCDAVRADAAPAHAGSRPGTGSSLSGNHTRARNAERTMMTAADGTLVEPLTDREFEVLQLVADGLTNKEIADQLILSAGTVKWYTGQIYGKLGVNKRTQAVARARELALLG